MIECLALILLFAGQEPEVKDRVTPEVRKATRRGLEWLCARQDRRGGWSESEWSLAVSSMAGLALAAAAHPGRGEYKITMQRFADRILSGISRQGLIAFSGDSRPALGHGFSVLFLTQVYGMFDKERNERIKEAISKGIDYIIKHQTSDGGWYEDYSDQATHYWLITVSQIQALRAARQTGFVVKKGSIKRAIKFVQGKDFCTCSAPCAGMDAALIVTLVAAGDYENPTVAKHIKSLSSKISYDYRKMSYPVFTHLYASQSMNFAGGERWDTYYQKTRDFLLRTQNAKGYWERMYHGHADRPPERVYATAVNCLILQMPLKSLPVFQYK